MPAKYRINMSLQLKYVTIEGKTNLHELRSLAKTYLDDPLFSFDQRHLIDLAKLTDARARFIDVFTLRNFYVRTYAATNKPVPVAIFAPTDLGFGISHMFSSLMMGQRVMQIEIFEHQSDALNWLQVDQSAEDWTGWVLQE